MRSVSPLQGPDVPRRIRTPLESAGEVVPVEDVNDCFLFFQRVRRILNLHFHPGIHIVIRNAKIVSIKINGLLALLWEQLVLSWL